MKAQKTGEWMAVMRAVDLVRWIAQERAVLTALVMDDLTNWEIGLAETLASLT